MAWVGRGEGRGGGWRESSGGLSRMRGECKDEGILEGEQVVYKMS